MPARARNRRADRVRTASVSQPLTVTSTITDRVALCVATGELDVSTVADLRTALLTAARDVDLLRLDLSGVGFIDTTALGALLGLRSDLQAAAVGFHITAVEGSVRQAIEITGLSELLA